MRDHLRTHTEGVAGFFVDHQVDVALAVALLGVGQAVVLVGQRAQRLGQQAHVGHFDVQVALAGTGQGAFGADDVAQVPGLDRGQGFFRQGLAVDVDLNTASHVLDNHERTTVEHDAAGDLDRDRGCFQLFLGLVRVLLLQVVAVAVATEVVGEGIALGTLGGKFSLRRAIRAFSSCCRSCDSVLRSLMSSFFPSGIRCPFRAGHALPAAGQVARHGVRITGPA